MDLKMRDPLTKVYLQSLAVVGTSDLPRLSGTPLPRQLIDNAGNAYTSNSSITVISGSTGFTLIPRPKVQLLRMTFSSVPVMWQSDLQREYQELGQALGEMTQLDESEDWKI